MAEVFISYSKQDYSIAQALASDLMSRGIDVWWDYQLYGGDDFHDVIMQELDSAIAVIVIWSDASIASRWVRGEAEHAATDDKLIPLYVPGFDLRRIPLLAKSLQTDSVNDRARLLRSLSRYGVGRTAGTPTDHRRNAALHKKNGEWDRALAELNTAISYDPNNSQLYCERAECYGYLATMEFMHEVVKTGAGTNLKKEQLEDMAIEDYSDAISLDPNNAEAYSGRGGQYASRQGETDRALADLNRAIQLGVRDSLAFFSRGLILEKKGYYDQALSDFSRSIQLHPTSDLCYYNRGQIYERQGQRGLAIADYRKALALNPTGNPTGVNRAYREALKRLGG